MTTTSELFKSLTKEIGRHVSNNEIRMGVTIVFINNSEFSMNYDLYVLKSNPF